MDKKQSSSALIFFISLIAIVGSHAAMAEETNLHTSPHLEETSWIVGARGLQLVEIRDDDTTFNFGGGLSLERNLVEGWLEVEVAAALIRPEGALVAPVDILLKKPFHFGKLCPYFGLGLAASLDFEEEFSLQLGPSSVFGSYFWFTNHIGIDFEAEYNLLFSKRGLTQEIVLAFGPAFRF